MGGTHFLITDASYILTHHRSGENSWSLSLLGCRVFSSITQLLHQAPKCTASGCAQPCVDHKCAENTKYAHTHTHTHAPASASGGAWPWRRSDEGPHFFFLDWLHDAHNCFWGRLPVRVAYEIKDVNVNKINCNYDVSTIPISQTVVHGCIWHIVFHFLIHISSDVVSSLFSLVSFSWNLEDKDKSSVFSIKWKKVQIF